MSLERIATMPGPRRLAVAAFACAILAFGLLAQLNVATHVGEGSVPRPEQVLWRYHGKPGSTDLHRVLDLALPEDDPHAMWPYLAAVAEEREARRAAILAWVDAGAPAAGWDAVAPVFTGAETCGQCHAAGGTKGDLPFDTYEHVLAVAQPDTGMAWGDLTVTAHNHAFGFSVAALLLGLLVSATGLRPRWQVLVIVALFLGPVLDVGAWFLTRWLGSPWHLVVMAGGGLFAAASAAACLAVLWDATLGRRRLARGGR
ncbi:MAG: hypothetical protein ACKOCB_11960 [Planctomycetia bacterium]